MSRFLFGLLLIVFLSSCRTIDDELAKVGAVDQSTFALIDEDSDGKVTIKELAAYKHAEGLAELNLNDDKNISLEEWLAAKPSAGENDKHFRFLDTDKDKVISEAEAISFLTANETFRTSFEALDEDEDGSLVWEEYEKLSPESLNVLMIEGEE